MIQFLKESSDSKAMNAFLMTIVGFFIGGAANIISAAITADLGKQGPIQGNAEGLATVTGIVDGTGSVGAAVGQLLVPAIQNAFNWFYVFYFFIVLVSSFFKYLIIEKNCNNLMIYQVRAHQRLHIAIVCARDSRAHITIQE